jgi:hypothetical protein
METMENGSKLTATSLLGLAGYLLLDGYHSQAQANQAQNPEEDSGGTLET